MIKIITDGASDITPEKAKELGITVIPIKVNFSGEEFIPGKNLSTAEFYVKLGEAKTLPTTSLINEMVYTEVIEEELSKGNEVFVMALSSRLSGSYAALERAAKEINSPRLAICDTLAVSFAQHLLIKEALKLIAGGATLQQLKSEIDSLKSKLRLLAVINDVTNLVKGGRLSGAAGFAASVLKIKPVVSLVGGEVKAVGKSMGVRQATETIIKMVKNVDKDRDMFYGHSNCLDRLATFMATVSAKTDVKTEEVSLLGPVVGTHAGQGCVGLAYFEK
ncbi:MAG: DegV family protein [Candidatus Coproplasma sp.]